MKINRYKKENATTHAIGVSAVIEALNYKKEYITSVIINPKGTQNQGVAKIETLCKQSNIELLYDKAAIEKLAGNENTYALAVIEKYTTTLNPSENHVILVNPSDMGNLGTICRTMLGLNHTNLAIIEPSADIFDPKTIKASMGAVFGINTEHFSNINEYLKKYERNLYAITGDGETLLENAKIQKPYGLLFGTEGEGLSEEYKTVGQTIKLRQSDKVDSYNLAIAVGITLYLCGD